MPTIPARHPALTAHLAVDWDGEEVRSIVDRALAEDVGAGDLTSSSVLPAELQARGQFVANEPLIVAGLPLVERVYRKVDPTVQFRPRVSEGAAVERGTTLAESRGPARSLLIAERVALNFLQRLSGIATLTRRYVAGVSGTSTRVLDTRKTTPGLRLLEKYAVRVGGGENHRMGLFDAVLIKENHVDLVGGMANAMAKARQNLPRDVPIEVEVRTLDELCAALEAGADAVLLDNMSPDEVRRAVEIVAGRVALEVSGGVRLENIRFYAETGVDYISVGALTHSAVAVDIRFDCVPLQE